MQVSRRLRASAIAAALVGGAFLSGCFLPQVDNDSYFLGAPLVPVGGATGSGRVEYLISSRQRSAYFELSGCAPNAEYFVLVDGAQFAIVPTDPNGHGALNATVDGSAFDPRGRRLSVVDGDGVEVMVLADRTNPAFNEAEVSPLRAFAPGSGFVMTKTRDGSTSVLVSLSGVDPGVYDVVADGVALASLDARSGEGRVLLAPPAFDPASVGIELQIDGVDYFVGAGHARIPGLDWCSASRGTQELEGFVSGFGEVALTTRSSCTHRFEVAIHNVPMGEYDLFVGGTLRGTIDVGVLQDGATIGTTMFSTDEHSNWLDFDPIGQEIEVERDGVPYFGLASFEP